MGYYLTIFFIFLSTKSYAFFANQIVKFFGNPTGVSSSGLSELLSFLATISFIGLLIGSALMILSENKSRIYIKGGQLVLYSAIALAVFSLLLGFTNWISYPYLD